ncbi:ABC transporter permease [Labrys wisconsinensis]|uniref:Simple sugar transport system permease protein n=1 Tax=Labrys wisconsinensis TaxID=425677 RepID=A0ABU0JDP5_9HYPH|nr:ABC transporter permease [Labrys wisconsinensis]MDQ0472406.1 simple sugar transport system permease protein [Labrys wisconsinensis]
MEFLDQLPVILASTVRLSAPLIFCCLAGLYSERSGVVDIGLEGKMLAAAFAAGVVAATWGSAWLGLAAAIVAAIVFSLIHGVSAISYRGNQIVSGVAINMLALGLTALLGNVWYGQGGRTPTLSGAARFEPITLPFAEALRPVPLVGRLYAEVLSGHNILVYVAVACVPLTAWVVYRTRFGLRLRAVGENPAAADTAGISVAWLRYRAVLICGVLTGLAGAYLSIAQSAAFVPNMTAGKGFMALAALIFAKWRPWPSLGACLLFGFLDAFAIQMQGKSLPLIGAVPVQLILALPYILTVVLLAGFIGSATPPRASGTPYVKER